MVTLGFGKFVSTNNIKFVAELRNSFEIMVRVTFYS